MFVAFVNKESQSYQNYKIIIIIIKPEKNYNYNYNYTIAVDRRRDQAVDQDISWSDWIPLPKTRFSCNFQAWTIRWIVCMKVGYRMVCRIIRP